MHTDLSNMNNFQTNDFLKSIWLGGLVLIWFIYLTVKELFWFINVEIWFIWKYL